MNTPQNATIISGIKDSRNTYLAASQGFSDLYQFASPSQLIGLSDYHIAEFGLQSGYYDFERMVDEFIFEDEHALRGETIAIFDVILIHEESLLFALTIKSPYVEHGKIQGSSFNALTFDPQNIALAKAYLKHPGIYVPDYSREYLQALHLLPNHDYQLTAREFDCIKYLLRGCSAKEIGIALHLSQRTVEFHISNIKDKLGVNKTAEIIVKALTEELV